MGRNRCAMCDQPDSADDLVGCNKCDTWMHFGCAGVTDSIADPNRSWTCNRCRSRGEGSIHSRESAGRSSTSRRSSRVDLTLQMMEEQKALRTRRILEEEAAHAAARKKIADEEEDFLRQKYALLIAEADGADGASRSSRLSSRASREKVQSWISGQETGASQHVRVAPSSDAFPLAISSESAHQSSFPTFPIAASTMNASATGNIPVIVASFPASTSTPNSGDDLGEAAGGEANMLPAAQTETSNPMLSTGKYVSRTEISFRQPAVSTSFTRCNSTVGLTSFSATRPYFAPGAPENHSAPPSVSSFSHQLNPDLPLESVSKTTPAIMVNNNPIVTNSISGGYDNTIAAPGNTEFVVVNSSVSSGVQTSSSSDQQQCVNSGCQFLTSRNFVPFATPAPTLSHPPSTYGVPPGHNTTAATGCSLVRGQSNAGLSASAAHVPLVSSLACCAGAYPKHRSQNPAVSAPVVGPPILNSTCSSTCINSNITSTGVSAVRPLPGNQNAVFPRGGTTFVSSGGQPASQPISSSVGFGVLPVLQPQQQQQYLQGAQLPPTLASQPVFSNAVFGVPPVRQPEQQQQNSQGPRFPQALASQPLSSSAGFSIPLVLQPQQQQQHSLGPQFPPTLASQPVFSNAGFGIPPLRQPEQQQQNSQGPQFLQQPCLERQGPSGEQIAARQVMPRELPDFFGNPQDWPLFYSSFCNSTEACGFSDSENLARLQR